MTKSLRVLRNVVFCIVVLAVWPPDRRVVGFWQCHAFQCCFTDDLGGCQGLKDCDEICSEAVQTGICENATVGEEDPSWSGDDCGEYQDDFAFYFVKICRCYDPGSR